MTATSTRPRQRGAVSLEDRRRQIVGLAAGLFDRHGYSKVTMEQIALSAGIAKPTLYHYFRGKDEILRSIHESFMDVLLERHTERQRLGLVATDLLLGVMTDILGLMQTHRGHVRVYFEHHRELPQAVREQIRAKRARYEGLVRAAVNDGIAAGQFRDVDPDTATLAIFGMCNWAYQWWRPEAGADPARTALRMWDLVMHGLQG
jgi:AcrR family transcriptional regulator